MKSIKFHYKSVIIMSVLILFDEILKYIIYFNFKDAIGNCPTGSDKLFHFHPIFNTAGNFFSGKFNLTFNLTIFILGTILFILIMLYLYILFLYKSIKYNVSSAVLLPIIFLFAAGVGRLIEKIFWQYILDFIAIKNFGIWDTIDVYCALGLIGLVIVVLKFDKLDKKQTVSMEKKQRKNWNKEEHKQALQEFLLRK